MSVRMLEKLKSRLELFIKKYEQKDRNEEQIAKGAFIILMLATIILSMKIGLLSVICLYIILIMLNTIDSVM